MRVGQANYHQRGESIMAQGVLPYKYEGERNDEGFCRVLGRVETKGQRRQQRRALERRWRKEHHRCVPSPSALFRYLKAFHDAGEERKREKGKAFIPPPH